MFLYVEQYVNLAWQSSSGLQNLLIAELGTFGIFENFQL